MDPLAYMNMIKPNVAEELGVKVTNESIMLRGIGSGGYKLTEKTVVRVKENDYETGFAVGTRATV